MGEVSESVRSAVVFPGMASSTFADVGRFMLLNPYARRRLAQAAEVLGYPVLERFRQAGQDYEESARVAFLINSMALADLAAARLGMRPQLCAGASFGQQTAAAYAGAMSFQDSVRLVAGIARLEEEYFGGQHPRNPDVVTHSFTRTPAERLAVIRTELTERGAWHELSAHLDDGFFMVSLNRGELDWFKERIRAEGGYSLYTMWPPVHASVFAPLRDRVENEVLGRLDVHDPRLPIVSDQDGRLVESGAGVRELLLDGVVRPIIWPDVITTLRSAGVTRVHVPGPENLFARLKNMSRTFETIAVTPRTVLRPVLSGLSRRPGGGMENPWAA